MRKKSVIDLVMLSPDLAVNMDRIVIDEKKNFTLESFTKTKKGVEVKKSDHNSILSTFKFKWDKHIKKDRN